MHTRELPARPPVATLGVRLVCSAIVLGIANTLIREPSNPGGLSTVALYASALVGPLVSLGIVYLAGAGRRWARNLYAIGTAGSVISAWASWDRLEPMLSAQRLGPLVWFLLLALQLGGLSALFAPGAERWFRRTRDARHAA
jgi:hypothetical protein